MIHPEKNSQKISLDSPMILADSDFNKLTSMRLFDSADIIQLFRMIFLCDLPDIFDEFGIVRAKNFSVVIKEDGTYTFDFVVSLEAMVKKRGEL